MKTTFKVIPIDDYAVIISDEEIKENEWLYDPSENSIYKSGSNYKNTKLKKVIATPTRRYVT